MPQSTEIHRLLALIRALDARGAVLGETTILKATYLLDSLYGVSTGFVWGFHRHGPYTPLVRDTLFDLSREGLISIGSRDGRGIQVKIESITFSPLPAADAEAIDDLASKVADLGVGELERISTAAWIADRMPNETAQSRADWMVKWKPHVARSSALRATELQDRLRRQARAAPISFPDRAGIERLAEVTRARHPHRGELRIYSPTFQGE